MAIVNLEQFLQSELNNFDNLKISYSSVYDYDYCANIFKICLDGRLDDFKNFLELNLKINQIFDWCFSLGKQSFLNFKIKQSYLINWLSNVCQNELNYDITNSNKISFIHKTSNPKKILYDYSSPNLAKDMHVGHLRSTIIGDTLANISEYIGHTVMRINHFGDFGLPFGMIVEYVLSNNITIDETTSLQSLYTISKEHFESDSVFKSNAYKITSELQLGTNENVTRIWNQIYEHSLKSYNNIYDILNISKKLTPCGESYYLQYIEQVKELLKMKGLLYLDENNRYVVNTNTLNLLNTNVSNTKNNLPPMIYEKSEEKGSAYTYDTTDIVTLWYRTQILDQDEIYYVVDSGQRTHFNQLIQVGNQMDWLKNKKVEHINFGIILNAIGKRIQSRLGNTPKLLDLITEGIETTRLESIEKNKSTDKNIDEQTIKDIAIGSIKYFDLARTRTIDYTFNYDLMLKFDSDSFTYIAYCMSRCRGIKDKFLENSNNSDKLNDIDYSALSEPDFKILKKILSFPVILERVSDTKMPHILCAYINELCNLLHYGYTNTRCLNFDNEKKLLDCNKARILLYVITSKLLEDICSLLGLPVVLKI